MKKNIKSKKSKKYIKKIKSRKTRKNIMKGKGQIFSSSKDKQDDINKRFMFLCCDYKNMDQIKQMKDKVSNISIGLFPAFASCRYPILDYLIENGANINYLIGDEGEYEYLLKLRPYFLLKKIRNNRTILMIMVKYYINNDRDRENLKKMFYHILSYNPDINFRCRGSEVYDSDKKYIVDNFTALMLSILNKNFYCILPLIKRGANIYDKVSYYEVNNNMEIKIVTKNSIDLLIDTVKKDETNVQMKSIIERMKNAYHEFLRAGFKTFTEDINKTDDEIRFDYNSLSKKNVFENKDLQKTINEYIG